MWSNSASFVRYEYIHFDASEQMEMYPKCFAIAALGHHANTGYSNMKMQIGNGSLFQHIRDLKGRRTSLAGWVYKCRIMIHRQIITFFLDACLSLEYF